MAAVERLKRRPDFLRVAGGRRKWVAPGLILQALGQDVSVPSTGGTAPARVGFTASAKVGNAVVRNRARRRLRAVAASVMPLHARPAHDYVLIARAGTLQRRFVDLVADLESGLRRLGLYCEDADIVPATGKRRTAMRLERALCIGLIRIYQYGISPLLPRVCRYGPSCSEYAREAIERHGAILGCWLAARRLLRCHPWGGHGYDPVPDQVHWTWRRTTHPH